MPNQTHINVGDVSLDSNAVRSLREEIIRIRNLSLSPALGNPLELSDSVSLSYVIAILLKVAEDMERDNSNTGVAN